MTDSRLAKEFVVGVAMLTKGSLEEKIRCKRAIFITGHFDKSVAVAFDIIDVNKSGSLDKEEMSAFLKCLVQSGPAAAGSTLVTDDQLNAIVEQAFTVIDANKDEKIEFEEFAKWASSAESGTELSHSTHCVLTALTCRQLDCRCFLLKHNHGFDDVVAPC